MPIIVLFAAYGVVVVARTASAALRRPAQRRGAFAAIVAVVTVALATGPAGALVAFDRTKAGTSTRLMAKTWIERHIRPGNAVAVELKGPDLTGSPYRYVEHYALPGAGTLTDYARDGYRYLVINTTIDHGFRAQRLRYPAQAAFYDFLRDDARRLARFHHSSAHGGPNLEVYDLGPSRHLRERDLVVDARRDASTLRFTSRNRVPRGDSPVPFDYRQLLRLHREARWSRRAAA